MRHLLILGGGLLWASLLPGQELFVQWTRLHPKGWEKVVNWTTLPSRQDPTPLGKTYPVDDKPGWVAALKVVTDRTVTVYGCDHYAVKKTTDTFYTYCWTERSGSFFLEIQRIPFHQDSSGKLLKVINPPLPTATEIRHGKFVSRTLWWEHLAAAGLPLPPYAVEYFKNKEH